MIVARPRRAQALVDAALAGDLNEVEAELARRPRVPVDGRATPDVERAQLSFNASMTALYAAAFARHLPVIERLLAHHAQVDIPSTEGMTPLLIACACPTLHQTLVDPSSSRAIVQRLIAAGANVNVRQGDRPGEEQPSHRSGPTPLSTALSVPVARRDLGIVQDLIAAGARVQALVYPGGRIGESMLHIAVKAQWPEAVATLIEAGVSLNRVDAQGRTPESLAMAQPASSVHDEIVGRLQAARVAQERSALEAVMVPSNAAPIAQESQAPGRKRL